MSSLGFSAVNQQPSEKDERPAGVLPGRPGVLPGAGVSRKIQRDAPCFGCGYNLRGLFDDGACPECGKPIRDWVRADRLDGLTAATCAWWRRGALLLQVGVLAALPLIYPGLVIASVGLWWLTRRPEFVDGMAEKASDRATRLAARWFLGLGMVLATAVVLYVVVEVSGNLRIRRALLGGWNVADVLTIAAGAMIVFGLASAWLYISEISRRIPDGFLAARCIRLRRQWFIGLGVFVVVGLFSTVGDALWQRGYIETIEQLFAVEKLYGGGGALIAGTPLMITLAWLWWQTLGMTVELRKALRRL